MNRQVICRKEWSLNSQRANRISDIGDKQFLKSNMLPQSLFWCNMSVQAWCCSTEQAGLSKEIFIVFFKALSKTKTHSEPSFYYYRSWLWNSLPEYLTVILLRAKSRPTFLIWFLTEFYFIIIEFKLYYFFIFDSCLIQSCVGIKCSFLITKLLLWIYLRRGR